MLATTTGQSNDESPLSHLTWINSDADGSRIIAAEVTNIATEKNAAS